MKSTKEQKILEKAKENMLKEDTRKLSIKEGCYASVMGGVGDSYITPFAIAIKSSNFVIGLISAFSGLLGPLSQLQGARLMEKSSRKKIITKAVTIHALLWFPILLLGILFYYNLFVKYLPVLLIVFYSFYVVAGSIAGPAWFSLMGDVVPEKIRGRYFSNRNRICGTIALISTLIASFFLDFMTTKGYLLLGYSFLFFIAAIMRLKSASLFRKHYEPKLKLEDGYYFSLKQFITKMPSNNFGKFVIFVALFHFSVNIAGPFFAVYMLRNLNFSITTFILVNISASIFSLLSFPLWGKFSDKYGNRETLKIGFILVSAMPFLWLPSPSFIYLMLVPQLVSGIGWAAFNLAVSNFIYDSVSVQRRGLCVAYHNVISGAGVFIGASIGGLLAQHLTISFMNILLFLFVISGALRLLVGIIMLPKVKEVKQVATPKLNPLLYLAEIKPAQLNYSINFIKQFFWRKPGKN